jgi:acyl-CoA synthetase (AMP-forming)/AMP-acid ligase II
MASGSGSWAESPISSSGRPEGLPRRDRRGDPRLENVEDVAVFGEKHALLGQIIVAKVVTRAPESVASLKLRIRKLCLERLAPFKVPSKIVLAEGGLYSVRLKKLRGSA